MPVFWGGPGFQTSRSVKKSLEGDRCRDPILRRRWQQPRMGVFRYFASGTQGPTDLGAERPARACLGCSYTCPGPSLLQNPPHRGAAFRHFHAVQKGRTQGHLTTHGLAELFSTLTTLPLTPRLLPAEAMRRIDHSVLKHFTQIPLGSAEYWDALQLSVSRNLRSGAIYGAFHLVGARAAGCTIPYTLNSRHFCALAPGYSLIISP